MSTAAAVTMIPPAPDSGTRLAATPIRVAKPVSPRPDAAPKSKRARRVSAEKLRVARAGVVQAREHIRLHLDVGVSLNKRVWAALYAAEGLRMALDEGALAGDEKREAEHMHGLVAGMLEGVLGGMAEWAEDLTACAACRRPW